jgi:hypothetical protein
MSDIGSSRSVTDTYSTAPPSTRWTGWVMFASFMMLMNGVIGFIEGLMALVNDDYYHVTASGLVLSVNYTAWGFVHLLLGAAIFASGIGVLSGNLAARTVGVVLAALHAVVALVFLEAAPLWGVIVILVDVLVIYALTVHGSEMRDSA